MGENRFIGGSEMVSFEQPNGEGETDQQLDYSFGKRVILQAAQQKAEIPDNAVNIQDRSEAPEGAEIIEGDRGGLYYVPAGQGEDDGSFNEEDAREFVEGTTFDDASDVAQSSLFDDPPATPESLGEGDKIAIMNPLTFEFEAAVVNSVDGESINVFTAEDESVEIFSDDVQGVYDDSGSEITQQLSSEVSEQFGQVPDLEAIQATFPDSIGFNEAFEERFTSEDLNDPEQFTDDLRDLIVEFEDDWRIGMNKTIPEIRNGLAEQGYFPDKDGANPYEVELPDSDAPLDESLDAMRQTEFDSSYDRTIAYDRLAQDRFGRDDVEVINGDVDAQEEYVQALEFANDSGLLDAASQGIVREDNDAKRGESFGWYAADRVTVKNTVADAPLDELASDQVGVAETAGDVLIHELGHANHHDNIGGSYAGSPELQIDRDLIEDEVSKYATVNEKEFVAEVFTGKLKGKEYSQEIEDYYDEAGGIDVSDIEGGLDTDALGGGD